jgi:protein-L-isoaspartate O-methyltransferase
MERIAELAYTAAARLKQLGYRNVQVRTGAGTLGWPERAPFDANTVAARGHKFRRHFGSNLPSGDAS